MAVTAAGSGTFTQSVIGTAETLLDVSAAGIIPLLPTTVPGPFIPIPVISAIGQ